jgi:hypothetical protein
LRCLRESATTTNQKQTNSFAYEISLNFLFLHTYIFVRNKSIWWFNNSRLYVRKYKYVRELWCCGLLRKKKGWEWQRNAIHNSRCDTFNIIVYFLLSWHRMEIEKNKIKKLLWKWLYFFFFFNKKALLSPICPNKFKDLFAWKCAVSNNNFMNTDPSSLFFMMYQH